MKGPNQTFSRFEKNCHPPMNYLSFSKVPTTNINKTDLREVSTERAYGNDRIANINDTSSHISNQIYQHPSSNCKFHPNKKAKYFVAEEQNKLFCSKCALFNALKGQKIEKEFGQDEKFKKGETDLLLEKIKQTLEALSKEKDQSEKANLKVKEKYDLQLKIVNDAFNIAENILAEERRKVVQILQKSLCESLRQTEDLRMQIRLFMFEVTLQERDIKTYYDNIVNEMDSQPFKDISNKYADQLSKILKQTQEISQTPIPIKIVRKILIPEILTQFFSSSIVEIAQDEVNLFDSEQSMIDMKNISSNSSTNNNAIIINDPNYSQFHQIKTQISSDINFDISKSPPIQAFNSQRTPSSNESRNGIGNGEKQDLIIQEKKIISANVFSPSQCSTSSSCLSTTEFQKLSNMNKQLPNLSSGIKSDSSSSKNFSSSAIYSPQAPQSSLSYHKQINPELQASQPMKPEPSIQPIKLITKKIPLLNLFERNNQSMETSREIPQKEVQNIEINKKSVHISTSKNLPCVSIDIRVFPQNE